MILDMHSTKTAYVCYKLYDADGNHIATIYEHNNDVKFYFPKGSDKHVKFMSSPALSAIHPRLDDDG